MTEALVPGRHLTPGDVAPWFHAPTHSNTRYHFDTVAGRFVVLSFIGSSATAECRSVLAWLAQNRRRFDDHQAVFFGVTAEPADIAENRLAESIPGIRWFLDADGSVARLYRALDEAGALSSAAPRTFVLDPALRILAAIPMDDLDRHHATLAATLSALPAIDDDQWPTGPAPVLIVPRILEPSFCRSLIEYYDRVGGTPSGYMSSDGERSIGVYNPSRKRRTDCIIEQDDLRVGLRTRLSRRLVPMIERAYQFKVSRIERYIVACYDSADRGGFATHRDNTTPATKHRRFAVTINLNAEEYEGGDLRLPEYGRRAYRAPTGGALVFSCSMLHEALPVTKGRRYATLPFLYDEAAAQIRDATRHLIVPVEMPPSAVSGDEAGADAAAPAVPVPSVAGAAAQ
ncbi:MAG: redoxin domain-containing protein [Alphaproteobacteria bacterium]